MAITTHQTSTISISSEVVRVDFFDASGTLVGSQSIFGRAHIGVNEPDFANLAQTQTGMALSGQLQRQI